MFQRTLTKLALIVAPLSLSLMACAPDPEEDQAAEIGETSEEITGPVCSAPFSTSVTNERDVNPGIGFDQLKVRCRIALAAKVRGRACGDIRFSIGASDYYDSVTCTRTCATHAPGCPQ